MDSSLDTPLIGFESTRRHVERMRRGPAGGATQAAPKATLGAEVIDGSSGARRASSDRAVQAFIFDVDGVIADTAGRHAVAWQRLACAEGLEFTPATADALRGLSRPDSLRLLLGSRTISAEHFQAMMDQKNAYYVESLERLSPDDLLPGVERLITELECLGMRLAAASASRNARLVLSRVEIDDRFDTIVDGNDIRRAKPHPDLFLRAAARMKIDPRRCVVVEDAVAGIAAARAAGMRSIGVGDVDRLCAATLAFASLAQVDAQIIVETLDGTTVP